MSYTDTLFEMRAGEDREVEITVTDADGVATSIAGLTDIVFYAKKQFTDADADAVIKLSIGSGLTVINAAAGRLDMKVPDSQTTALYPRKYRLAAQLKAETSTGDVKTIKTGRVIIHPSVRVAVP